MRYKTFGFTAEQVLMRDSVLALLERVLPPETARALDDAAADPADAYRVLAEAGWLALLADADARPQRGAPPARRARGRLGPIGGGTNEILRHVVAARMDR